MAKRILSIGWFILPANSLFEPFQPTSFVIEKNAEIQGFLVGFRSQTAPNQAYIHFVGIHPDMRGQGIGRRLYSRIGFNHQMEPLSDDETRFFLDQRWGHRVSALSDDFTDQEAVAAILRIARGNIRLIERLMMQVEHVLVANQITVVTQEVVETARKNLIIGPD